VFCCNDDDNIIKGTWKFSFPAIFTQGTKVQYWEQQFQGVKVHGSFIPMELSFTGMFAPWTKVTDGMFVCSFGNEFA